MKEFYGKRVETKKDVVIELLPNVSIMVDSMKYENCTGTIPELSLYFNNTHITSIDLDLYRLKLLQETEFSLRYMLINKEQKNTVNKVMTVSEASENWDIVEGTIRASIKNNRFVEGVDYRKSGRITLITREAMIRVYGESKTE